MPIRRENLDRYPADWPAISLRIRQRDGNRCKWCGVENHALGGRDSMGRFHPAHAVEERLLRAVWPKEGEEWWCGVPGEPRRFLRIVRIVLTVAHLNHQPEDCADDNLVALCQRCHNVYDMPHRRAGIFERAREGNVIKDLFVT